MERARDPENDNLRGEYADLSGDVPASIDFVDEALDAAPDAVNVWIGNERSVTSLHKDNYENIYVQVRGRKHFVLLAPVEMPCVNEAPIPFARYHPTPANVLEPRMYQDRQPVPVALWDPDRPGIRASRLSDSARPLRISLDEGDMMYLPALWYHKVSQTSGQEGFSCSVNFW
jgi:jumonji domain-containing protein 7